MIKFSLIEALSDPKWLIGITFEIWSADYFEREKPIEKGWEVGYMAATETDVVMMAGEYGIQPNDTDVENIWTNEDVLRVDQMTGNETYYQMTIKHLDGSDLSVEERRYINDILKD